MIRRFTSINLFFFVLASGVFAQDRIDAFKLLISVDQTSFNLSQSAKVRVKIENSSGHEVNLSNLHSVSINLIRYGKSKDFCIRDDCFLSSKPLPKNKKLRNGESFEFEVDLTELYWNDAISSAYDLRQPKNMAQIIHAGSYYLYVSLPTEDSSKVSSKTVTIRSNEILIKVD